MLINYTDPESSIICCDKAQVKSVFQAAQVVKGLFRYCPACMENVLRLLCETNCDPNMSVWFNIPPYGMVQLNSTTWYVRDVDAYVTSRFALSLYDSCSSVRYPGTNTKAVDFMCGGADECNATQWLHSLGDPVRNHGQINFIVNDTVKGHPDIKPNNHTFISCNTSDLGLQCSCADCPTPNICPLIPAVDLSWFRYVYADISRAIWCIGTALSIGIFILTLICALSNWSRDSTLLPNPKLHPHPFRHDVSGDYSQLQASPQSSGKPSSGVAKDGARSDSQFRHIYRCTGNVIQKMFYHWGCFCADHPFLVLIFTILPAIFCGSGVVLVKTSSDPVELWSQPDSQSHQEMAYFENNFGLLERTEQLIINAKPNISGYVFFPVGASYRWHFSPIFQLEVLTEVCAMYVCWPRDMSWSSLICTTFSWKLFCFHSCHSF